MVAAHEAANMNAERSCQRRQDPLVGGFAGFEALDRARENAGCCRQIVDAVAACDTKAYDARRQWFDQGDSAVSVPPLRIVWHHRFALAHQNAASIA